MTWNHRVIKHTDKIGRKKYTYYAIHEVYYNKKGKPTMVSTDPETILSEDKQDLKEVYLMMAAAFGKPILNYEDFNKGDHVGTLKTK